jgi:hypothetical protein
MSETKARKIRIDDQTWDRFGQLLPARTRGSRTRTSVLKEFIDWYIRTPGADLPDRPPARNTAPPD